MVTSGITSTLNPAQGEQTVYKILGIAAIMLFAWSLYKIGQENLEAMESCQQTRSYDTCAWDILR